jgi:hypothetical protein
MQRACNLGTDAASAAGDQQNLIAQRKIVIHDDHATQRYPKSGGGAQ